MRITPGVLGKLLPAYNLVKQMAVTHGHVEFASGEKRCKDDVIVQAGCLFKEVGSTLPPGGNQTSLEPIVVNSQCTYRIAECHH